MYVVRLDYATMAFTPGSVDLQKIQSSLAGDADLGFRRFGKYDTSPLQSPLGIYYKPDCGSKENPHIVQVSGAGCEHFCETLPVLAKVLRDGGQQAHFTRIDLAFDVIMSRDAWRNYLSKCFYYSMTQQRQRKKFLLQGTGEAMTVYIGSRSSDKFFRVYNKTLENPNYIFIDADGKECPVGEDQCVIRYEIESKWMKRTSNPFDPSPLFDWYYSDSSLLGDYIRENWLSFGQDVMLPEGFENVEFITVIAARGLHPLTGDIASPYKETCYANVFARLHDYPHSFDRSLEWAAQHYGAYIPYILRDDRLLSICQQAAKARFGFDIPFYVEFDNRARDEFDGFTELPDDSYSPWSEDGEFENIDILKGKEQRCYADFSSR